ncbi:MAG: precorrin-6y C5,15-methyltransferase (decarboxylating) subunit CbiE [Burkholderiales bacterium]
MNLPESCIVLGVLDSGPTALTPAARDCLAAADLLIGGQRTLALLGEMLRPEAERRDLTGHLADVPAWVRDGLAQGRRVVVLASGDPLCHGIAPLLIGKLGAAAVEVIPAVSTLQLAFARLKRPWQDAAVVSVHSKDAGEWAEFAEPGHGLYALVAAAASHDKLAVFTSPENGPGRIARALIAAGLGEDLRLSVVARLLLPDESVQADMPLAEAAQRVFPDPNVVVVERVRPRRRRAVFGFEDGDYIQRSPEKGLISKLEVRAVSLAKLRLAPAAVVWDIGAGSGSVGLEAARIARLGHVWAIEKNAADAANARENARRFQARNYTLVEGRAPLGLDAWPDPDAVFVGGSGGELAELIALILHRLKPGGRLVMNFVTLENLAAATAALAAAGAGWEVVQLQASRSQPILDMHRLAAQNPVWIVSAGKPGEGGK